MADEQIILKVSLDEGKTTDRLKQLTLDLETNRAAQKQLTADRKAGSLTDAEYAAQLVKLQAEQRNLRTEQTGLTKNLDLYNRAVQGVSGSYDQQQAQLSLAQKQYQHLAGSAENTTEETQALAKVIDELRGTLKTTDSGMGLFVRNVGNYGSAIEPLIQQMVKLQEEAKGLAAGSKEAADKQRQAAGFLTAAQRAAAQSGQTYDEATKSIENFAASIQPTVSELVKLEQEQARLVDTGEEATETVRRIGFQISKLEKDLKDTAKATPALGDALDDVGKESKKSAASLDDVAQVAGPLGGIIDTVATAKTKYTAAANLARAATAGQVAGLGALRVALIATGLGAFVVVLGSLFAFLTKTQAGSDFLSRKLGALGAVVTKLTSYVVDFGGKLFDAFQNPKQALSDLVDFIGQNLINRLTSVAVLIDGIRNGDFSKITDSAIQFTTGIANGTDKLKALTAELGAAADAGERLAQMEQELERATNDNISTNKDLLNQVERLKNVRDNEFNSLAVRQKANEDAFKVEMRRESILAGLAQKRIDYLRQKLELEGGRTRNEGLFKELQEAENELKDIREDAAGKQNELITNRYQLYKEGLDKEKEATDKAAEANRQALQVELGLLDVRLQQVRRNSDEELTLLRQKLNTQYRLELAAKDLTVGQKKLADAKYEAERTRLEVDAARARAADVLRIEVSNTAARLSAVAQSGAEELALQQRQLENSRRQQKAAIDARLSDEEQAAQRKAIDAAADRQQDDLLYADKLRKLTTFSQQQRNQLETDRAQNLVDEKTYTDLLYQQQVAALTGQLALAKKFGRDTSQIDQQLTDLKIGNLQRVGDKERDQAEERLAVAAQFGQAAGQLFADTLADSGKSMQDFAAEFLILLLDTLQQQLLATLAATVFKATAENMATPQSALTAGAAGVAQTALITGAITAAFSVAKLALREALSTTSSAKFERGTLLGGASHAAGGTGLFSRSGHYYGEAEAGEAVINKRSTAMFLPLLSQINELGGGRKLALGGLTKPRYMELGGVTSSALVREYLRGESAAIDYDALAYAASKLNIFTKTQEVMQSMDNVKYTQQVTRKD